MSFFRVRSYGPSYLIWVGERINSWTNELKPQRHNHYSLYPQYNVSQLDLAMLSYMYAFFLAIFLH